MTLVITLLVAAALLVSACGKTAAEKDGVKGTDAVQEKGADAGGDKAATGAAADKDAGGAKTATGTVADAKSGGAREDGAVTIQKEDVVVSSWISEVYPDENVSHLKDATYISVGSYGEGTRAIGLVRFALPDGIVPDDVEKATLSLKLKKGGLTNARIAAVTKSWAFAETDWNGMKDALGEPVDGAAKSGGTGDVAKDKAGDKISDKDGLMTFDVTDIVRAWLGGEKDNYGFSLTGVKNGGIAEFYSANADDEKDFPALTISYKRAAPAETYGRFGYTADDGDGNCLSYALRDKKAIYLSDLGVDEKTLVSDFRAGGVAAALEYFKKRVFDYLDKHEKELGVDSWRELKGADDKIDPEKEYLAVMKIGFAEGVEKMDDIDVNEDFDFHFRVRLSDGRWAEKMASDPSRIVPGAGPAYDAAKYPWDSNYLWGYSKWNGFYNSAPVYMAVTKSSDKFTERG
jgi:hypothetical protein